MNVKVQSCMIELLHFLNSDTYKGVENLAGIKISSKYSKHVIDTAAESLIDNGYVLGSKNTEQSKHDYFATCVTDKGLKFLDSFDGK